MEEILEDEEDIGRRGQDLHAPLIRQHPPSFASAAASVSLFFFSDSLFFYFTSPSCCGGAARFLVCVLCVCVCRLASTLVPHVAAQLAFWCVCGVCAGW